MLSHGVGTRADLPLPVLYVIIGGGLAVVASFVALGVLWRRPRLTGARAGRPLPPGVQSMIDSSRLTAVLRALVLGAAVLVVVVAFFGPSEVPRNLAPWTLYVTFWVGIVP